MTAPVSLNLALYSAVLDVLAKSIPIHSLTFIFPSLLLFFISFTMSCRIFFAKPEDLEMWPNHLGFRFLPEAVVSNFLQWPLGSFCEHPLCTQCSVTFGSISFLSSYSAALVSQAYIKMDMTRECRSYVFVLFK